MKSIPRETQTTSSGKARLFPLLVALACLLFGCFVATQHVASSLGYQAALGEPIGHMMGVPVYAPLNWIKWFFQYRHISHPTLDAAFVAAARYMGVALAVAAALAIFLRYLLTRNLQKVTPDLHGTAHWMPADEIKKSGLIGAGEGVYIGGWTEIRKRFRILKANVVHYLRHNGPEHVMAIAPTRSGKGVGLVLPTLLSWAKSVVVYDIKGEAWALTAGWRRSIGQSVLRFDPADESGTGVKYNPLEEVRLGTEREVADVQNLVTMIVDPDGKGLNDHWAKTGHALLVGAVLHVMYAEHKKTLSGVAEFLSDPARTFEDTLTSMLETQHDPQGKNNWVDSGGNPTLIHPVVAASARDMLNKAENERSGVLSTAMSFLTLFRDPIVAMNTSCSEFKINDLMNHDVPVSLYLVVRPSNADRLKPLTRLILNQIVRGLTEKMEFKGGRSIAGYKHRLLLLIDEFPSLGKLEIFEQALAFIAGYGMKAYLIIQDIAQLQKHYGREESVTSNCHVRIAFAPNRYETGKWLSDMVGTTTVVKNTYSYSGKRSKNTLDSISSQVNEVARPLLTPDEVMRLRAPTKDAQGNITDAGEMLIFLAGQPPIKGTQILYFLDPTFNERSLIEAPDRSDRVRSAAAIPNLAAPKPATPVVLSADAAQIPDEDDAEYEHPPLPDHALIGENDAFPESQELVDPEAEDAPEIASTDEEDPPLGVAYGQADAADFDDVEAEAEYDDTDAESAEAAPVDDVAPARAPDPFLSAAMTWAESTDVPVIQLTPQDEPDALDGVESSDGETETPGFEGDVYLALSRRWADSPPPTAAAPVTAPVYDTDDDTFAMLQSMAENEGA